MIKGSLLRSIPTANRFQRKMFCPKTCRKLGCWGFRREKSNPNNQTPGNKFPPKQVI